VSDDEEVREYYCRCGKFIKKVGGDPLDTQPVVLTFHETCPACAEKRAKTPQKEIEILVGAP
jgi:hypothetical protein